MIRPQITPENGPAIYNFYASHPARYARFGQMAMSKIWHPHTLWAPGVKEDTREHLDQDNALLWTTNHLNIHDQSIIAAAGYREEALDSTVNNYFVLVKPTLQQKLLLRRPVDGMGGIPVFRYKDFCDEDGKPNKRLLFYQPSLTQSAYDTSVKRIIAGEMGFLFSQGQRDKAETGNVSKIKAGIGAIATRIPDELNPAILVGGLYYPKFRFGPYKNRLRPTLVMSELIHGPFDDEKRVVEQVGESLQFAMDWAREISPGILYKK